MSVVKISHQESKDHGCIMYPHTEYTAHMTCACGHVRVTISGGQENTLVLVGADEGYDPVTVWCEDEDMT
ncbi:hypothetical protein LCGC14_2850890, partial [marine sediment metagenome]